MHYFGENMHKSCIFCIKSKIYTDVRFGYADLCQNAHPFYQNA